MKPNELCWCGSGRKYKKCHRSIDAAAGPEKYLAATRVYINHWRTTAEHHYKNGHYRWMSEQLLGENPKRILDIGCGSGHGLLSLCETLGSDVSVISVDENLQCIEDASALLNKHGIGASAIRRSSIRLEPQSYTLSYSEISSLPDARVVLIESDFCNDPYLIEFLSAQDKFDAVTIWLTGTHMFRQFNSAMVQNRITTSGDHRLYVQNTVYELADRILKKDGVLQVVDRNEFPQTKEMEADLMDAHRDQASPTSLTVERFAVREYKEPNTRNTPMVASVGMNRRIPDPNRLAITSVISRKK